MPEQETTLTPEELSARAARFYDRYGRDLEQIREILNIRLSQLALAYTIQNNLPPEAVVVCSRVKSLASFVKKLERKGWPQYYYPTEVVGDLIGARVICWFVDDCLGILKFIQSSNHLAIHRDIEDYIQSPKPSGYRSVHLFADVRYDAVRRETTGVVVADDMMTCEVQIRTKLQDAWGDLTHEFHYKAMSAGVENRMYERMLEEVSQRLASEDRSLTVLRDAYQALAEEKLAKKEREGFREG
jgi:putative GTP pyrophosphokinase